MPTQTITIEPPPTFVLAPVTDQENQRTEMLRQFERGFAGADARRRLEWDAIEDTWLDAKTALTGSTHTRQAYRRALDSWKLFLTTQFIELPDGAFRTVEIWEVDHTHVRAWVQTLTANGNGPATTNHYQACVSSFYSFVIHEKRLVNGVEIDLFVDRWGRTRQNPFRTGNIQRLKVEEDRPRPLHPEEYDRLLPHLEANAATLNGARNYALILTYLNTGWRSSELLRMKWGDVRPSRRQKHTMIFAWRGKGGKHQDDILPADCWAAILTYLKKAGRYAPGLIEPKPDEYIWLAVARPTMKGLKNKPIVDAHHPITDKSAIRILRTAAAHAAIPDASTLRIHDLRHTHAKLQLATGATMVEIRDRLHHSNISTTDRYLRGLQKEEPIDRHTKRFAQLRLDIITKPEDTPDKLDKLAE